MKVYILRRNPRLFQTLDSLFPMQLCQKLMKSLPLFTNIFNLTTYIIHPRVSNLHKRWIEMNRQIRSRIPLLPSLSRARRRKYLTSSPHVSTGLFHAALWNAFGIKGWNEGGRVESISPIIIRRSDRVWAGWRFNTTWRWQGDSFPPTAPHDLDFSSSLSLVIKSVTSVGVCVYIYIYSSSINFDSHRSEYQTGRSSRWSGAIR